MYIPYSRLAEASSKQAWQDHLRTLTYPNVLHCPAVDPQTCGGAFFLCRPPIRNLGKHPVSESGKVFEERRVSAVRCRGIHMIKSDTFIARFLREENGAAAAEYALLLAIIAAGLAVAAGTLGSAISNAIDNAADCIDEAQDCAQE